MLPEQEFVFWIALRRRQPFRRFVLTYCKITKDTICFRGNKQETLSVSDIKSCKVHHTHYGKSSGPAYVHIQMKSAPCREYYFGVVDVLSRNWDYIEILNFATIVESLIENQYIELHPNPYHRMFERYGKLSYFFESEWEPDVSPELYKERTILKKIRADITFDGMRYMLLLYIPAIILSIIIGQDEVDAAIAILLLPTVLILPLVVLAYWYRQQKTKQYLQEQASALPTHIN